MKNITIALDEETAQWVRIEAAKRGTSVSRLVGEFLHERRQRETAYQRAAQRYLERSPTPLKSAGERYPNREALHGRLPLPAKGNL
ncbi:hypothetical protein LRD18_13105, partial [Halorhodospira halochloris]|uniref:Ribbon-helix-helix protein CopG domain-containing protein n=1 Tax=Halorhodospira halochloris TaxID=1052 RepID=A0A0X8XBT3_HALHR|nr:hypothetical protein [Halorhodospira halochloris]MBK1651596.1 hypothetical protein [Halorhodospira halochloris]MCG5531775.1 hypothetical protein [Halorhodospira halochloris]MCG5549488.1 hypothetical protein [Halorhodospira halochloris]BAU57129.1 hypothetical protein HH1059_04530 [Halorhodospira halochloris]